MPEDPNPVPAGTTGTVKGCTFLPDWTQILVDWDNGRHLHLCVPPDEFELVK